MFLLELEKLKQLRAQFRSNSGYQHKISKAKDKSLKIVA